MRSAFILLIGVMVGACSRAPADGSQTDPQPDLIGRILAQPLPDDPGPDVGGKALQDEVFADGTVTWAEYERAVLAEAECIESSGYAVVGPYEIPPSPGYRPPYLLRLSAESAPGLADVMARCAAQWRYYIEWVWLEMTAPTEEETRAWLERLRACATELGIGLPDPPSDDDWGTPIAAGCRPWEE